MSRRTFLNQSIVAAGAAAVGAAAGSAGQAQPAPATPAAGQPAPAAADAPPALRQIATLPMGSIGKVKLSRMLLGGNLIGGWMHARDLKYVDSLFKAYATEEKILQTLRIAEEHGINTVFETGGNFVEKHNRTTGGHMQFIPHIAVSETQTEAQLKDHIKEQIDTGAVALYVWGVSSDHLVMAGAVGKLARAVELAKGHGLPVGVGSHSLRVTMECEKAQAPCDFYVKTLHRDDYPSATPKAQRKEFIWITGGPGWYDNMWCINPEETVQYMQGVTKPWIAFKVLAAGAIGPREGFTHAFKSGADFVAVGMLDFQVAGNCQTLARVLKDVTQRERPWYG